MIEQYGWSAELQELFQPHAAQGLFPGRVILQHRGLVRLASDHGELTGELSGRFREAAAAGGHPVAGDWVAASLRPQAGSATIHALMPRRTAFTRRAAGPGGGSQVAAANVDVALLVASLNGDLNPRRLERYLASVHEGGASPVFVLTKADLADDAAAGVAGVEAIAGGAPVLAVSAVSGEGMAALDAYLQPGRTAVLLGSSGVGKSTLVNALMGEERMATREIREGDERGRHTTTHRELVRLPTGALLVDTPGMRELGLWDAEAGLSAAFGDVEALAQACRFTDCKHETEPGCAILAALADGRLEAGRWANYRKLVREAAFVERKENPIARQAERKVWIQRNKAYRARVRHRDAEE